MKARRPGVGSPAHRVIQVQVRVKLGDQVVTLVQFRDFPWEPEDYTKQGGKSRLSDMKGQVGGAWR